MQRSSTRSTACASSSTRRTWSPQDAVSDARRTLYVLFGVLRLHNAQEEEGLFSLIG